MRQRRQRWPAGGCDKRANEVSALRDEVQGELKRILERTAGKALSAASASLPLRVSSASAVFVHSSPRRIDSSASGPVTATRRRTPLAIPSDSMMAKDLMSEVLLTWLQEREEREREVSSFVASCSCPLPSRLEEMKEPTDSRSTTELHTRSLPLGVLHILRDVLDVVLECHHPHGIRVCLSEHGSEARDLLREVEGELLRVDLGSPGDPVVDDGLDLEKVLGRDGSLVRKVKPELGGRDKGALLVDVVTEDVSEGVVEDVGGGVVLSDWGSSGLGDKRIERTEVSFDESSRQTKEHEL